MYFLYLFNFSQLSFHSFVIFNSFKSLTFPIFYNFNVVPYYFRPFSVLVIINGIFAFIKSVPCIIAFSSSFSAFAACEAPSSCNFHKRGHHILFTFWMQSGHKKLAISRDR